MLYLSKCCMHSVRKVDDAVKAAEQIGYPVMVRAAYALGGLGSGLCDDKKALTETVRQVRVRK